MNKIYFFLLICLFLVYSGQAQISWNPDIAIAPSHFGNDHPRIALDRSGDPMVIWSKNESVYFTKWNGSSFNDPVKLNPAGLTTANASWMGPDIAAHGDTIYIVAKRTPESVDSNRIFIFTSFDGGISFNEPVELAFIADSFSRFPTVETDSLGNPIVGYMKFNSDFLESRWVVTRSQDFGRTFSSDVRASGWGNSDEVCDCCPGAIASNGDHTAILYRDNNNNFRDIWTGLSTDNAGSFTSGFEVDDNNWLVMNCPASGPDAVIIGDTLYSTFMNGSTGKTRTYLSKTSLSTGGLGSVNTLTGSIAGLSQQNFPRIETDGKSLAIVWQQNVSGQSQLPILFSKDINSGMPAIYDTVAAVNIVNADVALANGNVYVIWEEFGTEIVKFRSGTYSITSSTKKVDNKATLTVYPNPAGSVINLISDEMLVEGEISIFDAFGNSVFFSDHFKGNRIDVSQLSCGIYLLMYKFEKQYLTRKFIKQ